MIQQSTYGTPRDDLADAIREHDFGEEGFVGELCLPVREVLKKSATVSVLMRENTRDIDVDHANGAAFARGTMQAEDLTYTCKDRGFEEPCTNEDMANYASDFDAEVEAGIVARRVILQRQELRIKTLLFNTTTWTGATLYTDNSASPWDTITTVITTQVRAAMDLCRLNCGFMPDSMLVGAVTLTNMLKNTGIKAQFPGAPIITLDMIRQALPSIFGLQNLFVGSAVYNSAKKGQAFVGADIWPDDYALIFKRQTGSLKSGGLGRTMLWTAMTPDNAYTESYSEPQTDSEIIRVRQFTDEKVFDSSFAHLLKIDA